ncbi:putative secreted protein [Lachnellula suecica]|uniref:Putative secreted protein n=1 Tax=Lachnellula suecica TaxID=602035 RepID=A0A8T9C8D2_9HELO|nr:putative secreted protein [Lachnellula suecica]
MSLLRSILALATTSLSLVAAANVFTLTASLPGNKTFDGQVVNAAGEAFYLGLEAPATYCPVQAEPCPNVTGTIVSGMTALWVEVPGGQEIYVAPAGNLGFTQAHSAYVPPGSYIGGFTNITTLSDCGPAISVFNWEAANFTTGGIWACPTATNATATYQIFAKTVAFNHTNCVELAGLQPHYQSTNAFGAWEYI